jgi:hypothetical protein
MAELYAQKLSLTDDRIKTASISEPTFTTKTYAESAGLFTKDAGTVVAGKIGNLEDVHSAGKITDEQLKKSISELNEISEPALEERKEQAGNLKDTAPTTDGKAVGEIIQKIAEDRLTESSRSKQGFKYYAKNWFDHLVRSTKARFIERDDSVTKEKEKELDRRLEAIKTLNAAFIIKYSNTKTFADRMLSISGDVSAKKMSAPAEQDKLYQYEGK